MSGICGIVDLHQNPIDPTHIHHMTQAAPHRAPDGTHHTQPHHTT